MSSACFKGELALRAFVNRIRRLIGKPPIIYKISQDAPPLPSTYTIITKQPQDWNPVELFIHQFEPASIDSRLHARFRPGLHAALEYYARNRQSLSREASRVKINDEHASGLDG